jgi:hypothetical protein
MHEAIQQLRQKGWQVRESQTKTFQFPPDLEERYGDPPTSVVELMSGIAECLSPDKKAWILCQADYAGESECAFRWNEWERISSRATDGDPEFEAEVSAFWDDHIPIYMSVRDGYSFAALGLRGPNKGRIVEGCDPDFEEVSFVADGLVEFVRAL